MSEDSKQFVTEPLSMDDYVRLGRHFVETNRKVIHLPNVGDDVSARPIDEYPWEYVEEIQLVVETHNGNYPYRDCVAFLAIHPCGLEFIWRFNPVRMVPSPGIPADHPDLSAGNLSYVVKHLPDEIREQYVTQLLDSVRALRFCAGEHRRYATTYDRVADRVRHISQGGSSCGSASG